MELSKKLLEAIAVTAELTGTELSKVAGKVMAEDLARFNECQVLGALTRCRRELKGRLTLADVIARLDDGRPGVEEAWAMIPKSERDTVVWTDEMARAMGVAHSLLSNGDSIGARMAFKEAYQRELTQARDNGIPVNWVPSLGYDQHGREGPIRDAVERGRIAPDRAVMFLPHIGKDELSALSGPAETLAKRMTVK